MVASWLLSDALGTAQQTHAEMDSRGKDMYWVVSP